MNVRHSSHLEADPLEHDQRLVLPGIVKLLQRDVALWACAMPQPPLSALVYKGGPQQPLAMAHAAWGSLSYPILPEQQQGLQHRGCVGMIRALVWFGRKVCGAGAETRKEHYLSPELPRNQYPAGKRLEAHWVVNK